jgi:hypothetical protein
MSTYPDLSVGPKPLTLERKVSVAPMMDWTDGAKTAFENSGLRGTGNRGSFLVALDIVRIPRRLPGSAVALIANNLFIAYDAGGGMTHEHHGEPR